MGCGVERSSCSLWSGLNAVVSLSSYERMLSACITTSRNKKEKCFFQSKRKRRTGNAIVASVQTQRDQGLVVPINSREIASCRHRQNRAAARDTTFGRALAEQLCYIAEEYSLSRPCRAVPRVAGNYVPSRGRLRAEQWACSRVLRASSRLLEMDVLVNRRIVSLVPLPTVYSHEGFANMFETSRAHPQCSTFMLD